MLKINIRIHAGGAGLAHCEVPRGAERFSTDGNGHKQTGTDETDNMPQKSCRKHLQSRLQCDILTSNI